MDSYPGRCPAAASRRIRTAVRNQIFRIAHFARRGRRPIDGTDGVHAASAPVLARRYTIRSSGVVGVP